MVAIENGRLCVKKSGRDAGRLCVIASIIDNSFVSLICAGRKKARKCNIRHVEPLPQKIDVGSEEQMFKTLVKLEGEAKA